MYHYKITDIELNDGSHIGPGNLTVIVGPNNVGKSRALRDILALCGPAQNVRNRQIVVSNVKWTAPSSLEELRSLGKLAVREDDNGNKFFRGMDPNLAGERNFPVTGWTEPNFQSIFSDPKHFAVFFGSQFVAHLSTQNRLQLVQQTPSPQRYQSAALLHRLYAAGPEVELQIRELIKLQFGVDIVLDFAGLVNLLFRVGTNIPQLPPDPRNQLEILEKLERLDDQGDGLRSFVGIMVALTCADRDVFLIDEPEAFLHPPQAFRMGEWLAEKASGSAQIFIATHSADVLQGLLNKSPDATILRIDRIGQTNLFRQLDKADLKTISGDPLLQSERVLDGIFYQAALIVEGDADVRFYGAASRKCSAKQDIYVVNAQNKQTVSRIGSLYRKLGIRCVGLVDFDALNDPAEFKKQIDALSLQPGQSSDLISDRAEIAKFVEALPAEKRLTDTIAALRELLLDAERHSGGGEPESQRAALTKIQGRGRGILEGSKSWSRFKELGADALPEKERAIFDRLSSLCAAHGLIINPYGELESMLADVGVPYTGDKRAWIQQALVLIQSLQVDQSKNLWKLMKDVHSRLLIDNTNA